MVWVYIFIYFLGAIITGLYVYTFYVKEYVRIRSSLKFDIWIENYDFHIFTAALLWFILVPMQLIIIFPVRYLIKRINKHYNIE